MKNLLSLASAALSRPAKKRRTRATAQPTEALEDRVLLSNVTVNFQNGDLKITGDSADNTLRVTQRGASISVEGLQGTTVNGVQNMVILTRHVPDDVVVSFAAGGNNTLVMQDMDVGDDVQIKGGRGSDHIAFLHGQVGDLLINTGRGRDGVVAGDMEVLNDVQIKTGSGNDFVVLAELDTNDDLSVSLSGGNDEFYAMDLDIQGDTTINGGSGGDSANQIGSTFGGTLNLNSVEGVIVNNANARAIDLALCIYDEFANL